MLSRRGLIATIGAGVGSLFIPKTVLGENKENRKWWTEEDFEFEGYKGTFYVWPTDRIIHFDIGKGTVIVPCFDIRELPKTDSFRETLRKAIVEGIKSSKFTTCHAHVIQHGENNPNNLAILIASEKCKVVEDQLQTSSHRDHVNRWKNKLSSWDCVESWHKEIRKIITTPDGKQKIIYR